jgi:fatty-acyl-CoA synthase
MTPLNFIQRTASIYPKRLAIIHGSLRQDWLTTYQRCKQLASALTRVGIKRGYCCRYVAKYPTNG